MLTLKRISLFILIAFALISCGTNNAKPSTLQSLIKGNMWYQKNHSGATVYRFSTSDEVTTNDIASCSDVGDLQSPSTLNYWFKNDKTLILENNYGEKKLKTYI